jgi:hypothetical protein
MFEHVVAIVSSVTLQYFIAPYFWPELAFNDTYWASGVRGGKNQLFLSPGIVFGRFVLFDRLKAVFGISYQFAVLPEISKTPVLTPVYNHAWLLTMRMPFLSTERPRRQTHAVLIRV